MRALTTSSIGIAIHASVLISVGVLLGMERVEA